MFLDGYELPTFEYLMLTVVTMIQWHKKFFLEEKHSQKQIWSTWLGLSWLIQRSVFKD